MSREQEFFIGWEEKAPASTGRFVRRVVVVLLLLGPLVGLLLAASQAPFDDSHFEFGDVRTFEGLVELTPHPVLRIDDELVGQVFYLVAVGKHGAGPLVATHDGARVRLDGTLIHRREGAMIEVVAGSVEALDAGDAAPDPVSLGVHRLVGEVVDSKCWLGVMKPGWGKAHRACASLCIRGGIPPLFVVRNAQGEVVRQLLLVGPDGEAVNEQVLDFVAEPVALRGEILRDETVSVQAANWIFRADLGSLERLE